MKKHLVSLNTHNRLSEIHQVEGDYGMITPELRSGRSQRQRFQRSGFMGATEALTAVAANTPNTMNNSLRRILNGVGSPVTSAVSFQ
jgi:hypothetical protein